ncbi:MAG: ribonuclease HI [Clostridia bacterium]|nr:ribonuclease HI [Clostridia bacterium]
MKFVQIGAIGHYAYALPTAKKYRMDLCGVCYPDPEDHAARATKSFEKFGFSPRVYETVEEMLEREKPDVAVINTVMSENGRYAELALGRGISVFCEKPVATTLAGLDRLERVYAEAKRKYPSLVFCGMFGIDYLPHFETAYRFVKAGGVGEVMLAHAQKSYRMGNREKFYSDREKYGGTIPWVAIHGIEWITRIAGLKPITATALGNTAYNGGNGTMEASTMCMFGCEKGKMASVSADVMRPATAPTHDDDRLRIVGSEGVLEVCDGRVTVIDNEGKRELNIVQSERELFEEMILEMRGGEKCRVSAEDSFFATRVALTARESQDTGKTLPIVPAAPALAETKKAPAKGAKVTLYTDGACKGNPGPGGWGCVLVYGDNEKELSGGEAKTTNNRMELSAAIAGLSALKTPCEVELWSDSKYLVDAITKGWARSWKAKGWKKSDGKPALNPDLWERLLELLAVHKVTFVWVKGHDGHEYNERCDRLAVAAAERYR